MTQTASPSGAGLLPYPGSSVRYLTDADAKTWLVARDFLSILKLDVSRSPGRWLTKVGDADKEFRTVQSPQGPQRSIVLSIPGALALTRQRKRPVDRAVRAFLNREAAHLLRDQRRD